jgi:2-polyprenyl-3-methyl-5-hydroxy-6-metoxy-1,4-benzoquinol methylase
MNRQYQHNFSDKIESVESMYDAEARIKKAKKTLAVLFDYLEKTSDLRLLDIGSSTGIMTNEYSKYFGDVIGIDLDLKAVDFANSKFKNNNLKFINSPIEEVNFENSTFDIITCSHIYEHVPSDKVLIDKIYSLLKPGGICYFAAGNRYQIIEAHYRLPFLSYFPKNIANIYIKLFTKEKEYYENLKSYRNLKKLVIKYEIIDYTLKILKNPTLFSANDMVKENTIKYYLVNFIAKIGYFVIPTYIWILKKPE